MACHINQWVTVLRRMTSMTEGNFPILSLVILLPLLGGIATGFTRDINAAKKIALLVAGIELIATLVVVQWLTPPMATASSLLSNMPGYLA